MLVVAHAAVVVFARGVLLREPAQLRRRRDVVELDLVVEPAPALHQAPRPARQPHVAAGHVGRPDGLEARGHGRVGRAEGLELEAPAEALGPEDERDAGEAQELVGVLQQRLRGEPLRRALLLKGPLDVQLPLHGDARGLRGAGPAHRLGHDGGAVDDLEGRDLAAHLLAAAVAGVGLLEQPRGLLRGAVREEQPDLGLAPQAVVEAPQQVLRPAEGRVQQLAHGGGVGLRLVGPEVAGQAEAADAVEGLQQLLHAVHARGLHA
mmetsp:Transcript_68971/g.195462  ORF Transcript_68971/g.195462 Transcript_68971/m.195462 type:complete len:264 (-) Transcript_68971:525-1316(-)